MTHLVLVSVLAAAAPAAPARTADAILDDYARAVGGEAALAKHRSLHIKSDVEAKGMQIKGSEERWLTSKGKMLSVTSLPAIGNIRQGSNGKVRWSEDPINGLRILKGAEDEAARIDGAWSADVQMKKLYKSVRTVDPPTPAPAGKRYECVELTAKQAKPTIACFDAETHLRAFQQGAHATPQGEVPYTAKFDDWRVVDGVKIAHLEEMSVGVMTLEQRIVEAKFDEKVDDKMFDVPKASSKPSDKAAAKP
jgi:hypothetical protein